MTFTPLKSGDTIGVFSPASRLDKNDLDNATSFMESQGFKVKVHPQSFEVFYQSAGTTEQKAQALHDLFLDNEVKAVFAARGGNRALHLLDEIDFELLKKHPKPLIGYSDVTALLNAIYVKTGHFQVHGPVFRELNNSENSSKLLSLLMEGAFSYDWNDAQTLKSGDAQGCLFGGNMTLIHHMIGTDNLPDLLGAILFLEDVSEELSRLDRTMCHLRQLGISEKLSGLIFGSFTDLKDTGTKPFGFSLEEVIAEHTQHLKIPVIMNAPIGHGAHNWALPIGQKVNLAVSAKKIELFSSEV